MSWRDWIWMPRSIVDREWYTEPSTFIVLVDLLFSASTEPESWQGIPLKRGQAIVCRRKLSVRLGISEQAVRTALRHLETSGDITIQPTSQYLIITICSFDDYD